MAQYEEMFTDETMVKTLLREKGIIVTDHESYQLASNTLFVERPVLSSDISGGHKAFVFMTRPNCNIVERVGGRYALRKELNQFKNLAAGAMSNLPLYGELCRSNCKLSNIFNLASNYIQSVSPVTVAESDREGVTNKHNYKTVPFGGVTENTGLNVQITFGDDNKGNISKLWNMVSSYKTAVHRTGLLRNPTYVRNKAVDYSMSMWLFVVDQNYIITSMGVYYGMVPTDRPTHDIQKASMDPMTKEVAYPTFTVNFAVSYFVPMPEAFGEIDKFNTYISQCDFDNLINTNGGNPILFEDCTDGDSPVFKEQKMGSHLKSKVAVFDKEMVETNEIILTGRDIVETNVGYRAAVGHKSASGEEGKPFEFCASSAGVRKVYNTLTQKAEFQLVFSKVKV